MKDYEKMWNQLKENIQFIAEYQNETHSLTECISKSTCKVIIDEMDRIEKENNN